jgi:hypothetical protein
MLEGGLLMLLVVVVTEKTHDGESPAGVFFLRQSPTIPSKKKHDEPSRDACNTFCPEREKHKKSML